MTPMANEIRQQIAMLVKLQDHELEIGRIQQALSQVNRRMAELDAQRKGQGQRQTKHHNSFGSHVSTPWLLWQTGFHHKGSGG